MKKRLSSWAVALFAVLTITPFVAPSATAADPEASAVRNLQVINRLPYALRSGGFSSFPFGAPAGSRFIDVRCKPTSRDATKVEIRGTVITVSPNQTVRFASNKELGLKPRRTTFVLKLSGEDKHSWGVVKFLR